MSRLLAGALVVAAFCAGIATARIGDDDPLRQPIGAEIEAAVLVDATAVEMHGFDSNGEPGVFTYDCEHAADPKPGDPTLVCTQREIAP